jgi:hypothetical protein
MKVVKTRQSEWNERIARLISQIQDWSESGTEKTVEVVSLFFGSHN